MKAIIVSDIHGSGRAADKIALLAKDADLILCLGDILYHGPRNDLPEGHDPKHVISVLNPLAGRIVAVRGNCEAEVDQMVLAFPCMADHNVLLDPDANMTLFLTHGHIYGPGYHNSVDAWPALPERSAIVYGHTHIKVSEKNDAHDAWVFNPGSVGIPKDGSASYGVYEDGRFEHRLL